MKTGTGVVVTATIFVLLSLTSEVYAQTASVELRQPIDRQFVYETGNLKYIRIIRPSDPGRLKRYRTFGVEAWARSIKKAAMILPKSFIESIGITEWEFRADSWDWVTGNPGLINLTPSKEKPDWMIWEPFNQNGFTEAERVYVALHEISHLYSFGGELIILNTYHFESGGEAFWAWDTKRRMLILESTFYIHWVLKGVLEDESTLYGREMGRAEDFADTFALYVMWPEYLKTNFPLHYLVIKKILGKEYKSEYPLPNSVKSRLAVRW